MMGVLGMPLNQEHRVPDTLAPNAEDPYLEKFGHSQANWIDPPDEPVVLKIRLSLGWSFRCRRRSLPEPNLFGIPLPGSDHSFGLGWMAGRRALGR